jgi:Flp pilus assembly protein TadD
MSNEQRAASLGRYVVISLLIAHCSLPAYADEASQTAHKHYLSGLAYERLGRLEEAYTQLQLACALESKDARMALALGVVSLRLGNDEVAQRSLEQSVAIDANSTASYYQLAFLYEKLKATDRAIDSWNRFLELTRDDVLKLEARKHLQYLESQAL